MNDKIQIKDQLINKSITILKLALTKQTFLNDLNEIIDKRIEDYNNKKEISYPELSNELSLATKDDLLSPKKKPIKGEKTGGP